MIYRFDSFELDTALFELRKDGQPCLMEPQVFEVLSFLVQNHERLVTKDELLDHVWPERYITEAALNSRLMAARKVLGDSGREQRYIKTVHGRGYRFVGAVETQRDTDAASPGSETSPFAVVPGPFVAAEHGASPLIGRDTERTFLAERFARAVAGDRQVVFVTGEPGIGKTRLVDHFVSQVEPSGNVLVARGQCIDYRGSAEAYMPVLEAFGLLARGPERARLVELMAERAPMWLSQLPWLVKGEELEDLRQRTVGTTRERMLREMVELLEVLSAAKPFVLVLEDIHWTDYGTLDLIDAVARRQLPARLLVLATYRPSDVHTRNHPLAPVQRELRARGYAAELSLSHLSVDGVEEYLAQRLPGCDCPSILAEVLHRRTDGNPLFVANVLESWISNGSVQEVDGGWSLHASPEELAAGLPDTLRDLIGLQLEQVDADARELLAVASVAGTEFSAAQVIAGSEQPEEAVESTLSALAVHGVLIDDRGAMDYPDGSVTSRFGFAHDLYQEVLYDGLPPARQARLHLAIGERTQTAYGESAPEHAAELAMHFARGRKHAEAVRYLLFAARQAQSRAAPREALEHVQSALAMLDRCRDSEREEFELPLKMLLPPAMLATRGFADPAVEEAYLEALDFAAKTGDDKARASLTYSLAALHEYRGNHEKAYEVLGGISPELTHGDRLAVEYHALLSCTHFHRGGFAETIDHADNGLLLDRHAVADPRFAVLGEDPGVGCNEWSSNALWFLGYPDRALDRAHEAIRLASVPERSYSLASAQTHAARVHHLRREPARVREIAAETVALATECGFSYHLAVAVILEGWAMTMLGDPAGPDRILEGLGMHEGIGADMDRSYFLSLRAEALCAQGEYERAGDVLNEAHDRLPNGGLFFYEAEIHRLQGEAAVRADPSNRDFAEQCYASALEIARRQGARSLELRAAMSMARLRTNSGDDAAARDLVQPVYEWFTEGHDTTDLQEAHQLLEPQPAS